MSKVPYQLYGEYLDYASRAQNRASAKYRQQGATRQESPVDASLTAATPLDLNALAILYAGFLLAPMFLLALVLWGAI